MKESEFVKKIEGLAKVLQESDIMQRAMKLSEQGKRSFKEGSDWSHTRYDYFFTSSDQRQNIYINSEEAYHWGMERELDVKYNGKRVLLAEQCSENIPKSGYEYFTPKAFNFENAENRAELFIYVKQSDSVYKVKYYEKGAWEDLITLIETEKIVAYKAPEQPKPEPEMNNKHINLFESNFKL